MNSMQGQAQEDLAEIDRPHSFWQGMWLKFTVMLAIMLIAVAIALWQLIPPNVIPASAPATEFSAERAMQDLKEIAQKPHPIGSVAHTAVREYLVNQLKAMGLQPEVQTTTVVQPGDGGFGIGRVHNVIVRIPGRSSTGAIVIDAHYDAAENGPGASDCGSCVVTALETLRSIRAGAPLNNDVIVVFADGEENGMLGARAFATEHPWMKDVKLTFNFEAGGSRGASILYITSRHNQRLIEEFVKAIPYPRMSSFSPAFWSFFPGAQIGCDLDEYMAKGSAGLGFAYMGDTPAYHTSRDNVNEIDPRSIQHNGSYTLAGLRHFGNLDLKTIIATQNAVYFNILPNVVIHYPEAQILPFTLVVSILFVVVVYFGMRHRQLTIKGMGWGAIAFCFGAIGAVLIDLLVWWTIQQLNPALHVFLIGNYQMYLYEAGLIFLTLALMSAWYTWLFKRFHLHDLALGALLVWMMLMLASSAFMPGASYLFTVPLLFNLLVWGWIFLTDRCFSPNWQTILLLSVAAIPGIVLLLPIQVYYFASWMARFEGLVNLQGQMNIPLMAISMVFTVLLFGLLIPQLAIVRSSFAVTDRFSYREAASTASWLVPGITALIALILFSLATLNSGFSATQPRPNSMAYSLDADRGQASWISRDRHLDAWTTQFFTDKSQRQQVEFGLFPASPGFSAAAPLVNLPAPEVRRLAQENRNGGQQLRLQIVSPRLAPLVQVRLTTPGRIDRMAIDNKPLDLSQWSGSQRQNVQWIYFGLPPQGIELSLELATLQPVQILLKDCSWGLPSIPGKIFRSRPAEMMPAPGHPDYTIVTKKLTF